MTPLPEKLRPLADEIAAYYRELPRLVAEGQAGRVALVKAGAVTVWDTEDDAVQHVYEKYGADPHPYLAQPIDPRDIDRLAPYLPAVPGTVPA